MIAYVTFNVNYITLEANDVIESRNDTIVKIEDCKLKNTMICGMICVNSRYYTNMVQIR